MQCPLLAQSGHDELHRTCPLSGESGHRLVHRICLLLTQSDVRAQAEAYSTVDLFHSTEGFHGVNNFPTNQCELRLQRVNFVFRGR